MTEVIITSSVLILAVLALRLIFAKRVRRRLIYALWAVVALRLLIPVQIGHNDFSLLTPLQTAIDRIAVAVEKPVGGLSREEANEKVLQEYLGEDLSVFSEQVRLEIENALEEQIPYEQIAVIITNRYHANEIYAPETQSAAQLRAEEMVNSVTLGRLLTILWLSGVGAMVLWLAGSNFLLSRRLNKGREKLECDSRIPVYLSKNAVSPCLVGLFRATIYLPPESWENEQLRPYVLAHEQTHYAHKDQIWALVRCICLCVYWFNPLVWVAAWFSRRDCELACDEGAMERLGEEHRLAYGKALLDVVSQKVVAGRLMLTATTMAETKKQLGQRIRFIAKKPKWSTVGAVAAVLICLLVTGCVAAGPTTTEAEEEQPSWVISEEMELQIKQDYVHKMDQMINGHSCTTDDVSLVVVSHVDSGYAVIISCKCGSVDLDASWDELYADSAAGLRFYMPNGWFLSFYKDGQIRTLQEAYNLKWVNYPQVKIIWNDYHAQFPKALETWEQTQN